VRRETDDDALDCSFESQVPIPAGCRSGRTPFLRCGKALPYTG
jgi:hypothetical protein